MSAEGMTSKEIQEFVDNHPEMNFYAGMLVPARPGVRLCMVRMEYENYIPDTPSNDNFQLFLMKWQDMTWALMGILAGDVDKLIKIAADCGVQIADGVPTVFSGDGVDVFPVRGGQVFSLENTKDHVVYQNDPNKLAILFEMENGTIEEILEDHRERYQRGEYGS